MTSRALFLLLPALLAAQPPPTKSSLATLSGEIRALTARASRAVVEIQVSSYSADENAPGAAFSRRQGLGSGVIIDSHGYIVTNAHVVAGSVEVKVLLSNQRTLDARILGIDRETDLAVLKVAADNLPVLTFAPPSSLRQGDLVLAIGNPLGLRNSVSLGVVSAIARTISDSNPLSYIQTDASINPGNSGGALVDTEGRLVGINTFIFSQSGGNEGLGFAIPAPLVRDIVQQLRTKGYVDRGEIGVVLQDLNPTLISALSLPVASGAIVADVEPDSPADRAGLQIGDLLLSVNGQPTTSVRRFSSVVYAKPHGEKLTLQIQRGDKPLSIQVTTRARRARFDPLGSLADPAKHLLPRLGVLGIEVDQQVAKLVPGLRHQYGVIVAARSAEGLPQPIDLQPGDVIYSINGISVASLDFLQTQLRERKAGAPVALQIEREGHLHFVTLDLV